MLNDNIILLTDSYKNDHAPQYRRGTTRIRSYFATRVGAKHETIIPFGFQYPLLRYLTKPITMADIDEAESYYLPHMGTFDRSKWEHIVRMHGGLLPVVVEAVPEGLPLPATMPLMKVVGTDSNCWWLTNALETLLVQDWYPTTVATQSMAMRQTLKNWLAWTGDPSLLDFKLHDFGCRGATCMEQAAIGGAGHLATGFQGTDTVPALQFCRLYYGEHMAGFSIPASEHSTITSWGEVNEVDAYRNMIRLYGHLAYYACVSDSYDLMHAVRNLWGGVLREEVLAAKGTLVVRPDSGDPHQVLPELLQVLWEQFGGHVNAKGYRVLNPKVRVIQGDGITADTLGPICATVAAAGFSLDNLAFGSGGGLLQQVNRDTERFAFKCCETEYDDHWHGVQKRPKTDPTKASMAGDVQTYRREDGSYVAGTTDDPRGEPVLREVFRDGRLVVDDTLADIRARAQAALA